MITLAELTQAAIEAKDFRREKQAMAAVAYMEANGLTEATAIGHYGVQSIQRGTKVRLKAGAAVRSTHPKYRGVGYDNPKTRTLNVFDVYTGYVDYHKIDRAQVRNPEVVWVGTGGYWFYTDINNVEFI